jgi:predicted phage tail protein
MALATSDTVKNRTSGSALSGLVDIATAYSNIAAVHLTVAKKCD